MEKTKDAVKRMLKEQFEKTANTYLVELLRMYEWDSRDGFWIGDEVGGTYAYGDSWFFSYDEMRYIVENDVPFDVYDEWADYVMFAIEFNQNQPNLKSWVKGCPRLSKDEQKKLIDLKQDLKDKMKEFYDKY